ncbi:sigma-70 family RNA polymerase sigma factor [Terrisporobacter sp.]|uniref:sigma-70 family RNA polymerase sigma factor n=1 Tax=Terrisporobacter sp. TaxID=1965305 RepID=UPI0039949BF8
MKIIKLIIDDVVVEKEMTVDEVFKQFDNMLKKFASECVFKSKTMHNNILGFEDFYGEGCIKLVESYNAYRPIDTFSSYLQNNLNARRGELLRMMHTGKRKVQRSLVSFDVELDDGSFLKDIEGKIDESFDDFMCNEDVKIALRYLNDEEKTIINHLSRQEKNKKTLAEELGISRPTLDTRISKTRHKFKSLMPEYIIA